MTNKRESDSLLTINEKEVLMNKNDKNCNDYEVNNNLKSSIWKTIAIFIGLKILEIAFILSLGVISFDIYLLSSTFFTNHPKIWHYFEQIWLWSVLVIFMVMFISVVSMSVYAILKDWLTSNWKWAKKLSNSY